MITKPLEDAKKGELEAELELYRAGGIEDVATFGFTSKNADRVAEIERLRALHGHPMTIDEDFLAGNPELVAVVEAGGDKLAVGETVFFSEADLAAADEQKKPDDAEQREALLSEVATLVPDDKNFLEECGELETGKLVELVDKLKADASKKQAKEAAKGAGKAPSSEEAAEVGPELVYQRKTVVRTENVIANGKSYKDVTVATGETFRITPEEYESDVKPRA